MLQNFSRQQGEGRDGRDDWRGGIQCASRPARRVGEWLEEIREGTDFTSGHGMSEAEEQQAVKRALAAIACHGMSGHQTIGRLGRRAPGSKGYGHTSESSARARRWRRHIFGWCAAVKVIPSVLGGCWPSGIRYRGRSGPVCRGGSLAACSPRANASVLRITTGPSQTTTPDQSASQSHPRRVWGRAGARGPRQHLHPWYPWSAR